MMNALGFKKVSVVIPVYNEETDIGESLSRVLNLKPQFLQKFGIEMEVIIVDDGSSDNTPQILKKFESVAKVIRRAKNGGKGAAVREGFKNSTGDILFIQDADLEYDPSNIFELIVPILEGKADAVYGSRYLNAARVGTLDRTGHMILNFFMFVTTGFRLSLTDMETCQKVMSAKFIKKLNLYRNSFTIEVELTLKLFRAGAHIIELPIGYKRRVIGKKAKIIKDGIKAVLTILLHGVPALFVSMPTKYEVK